MNKGNRKLILAITILFIKLTSIICLSTEVRPNFKKQKIQIGTKTLFVEVAKTPAESAYGFMFKKSLRPNEGMLFIFESERPLSFWMKNTFVDLSIAYIDAKKTIIDLQDMDAAQSELQSHFPSYPSAKPAQYALEMKRGWFKANNVKLGDKLILFDKH